MEGVLYSLLAIMGEKVANHVEFLRSRKGTMPNHERSREANGGGGYSIGPKFCGVVDKIIN